MAALAKMSETRAVQFVAEWHEVATVLDAARKRGWTDSESVLDVFDHAEWPTERRVFATLKGAEKHLQFITANGRDMWGQAFIYEVAQVSRRERCRYCTCGGSKVLREHIVEETGIIDTSGRDDCHEDDGL
jgi:hypothetical protein